MGCNHDYKEVTEGHNYISSNRGPDFPGSPAGFNTYMLVCRKCGDRKLDKAKHDEDKREQDYWDRQNRKWT